MFRRTNDIGNARHVLWVLLLCRGSLCCFERKTRGRTSGRRTSLERANGCLERSNDDLVPNPAPASALPPAGSLAALPLTQQQQQQQLAQQYSAMQAAAAAAGLSMPQMMFMPTAAAPATQAPAPAPAPSASCPRSI